MKVLAMTVLIVLLGIMLATMSQISVGMGGHHAAGHMIDCPFMSHEEVVCPMTVLDHLAVIRSVFSNLLPGIVVGMFALSLFLLPAFLTLGRIPLLLFHTLTLFWWRRHIVYRFSYRILQELFAQGILHTKRYAPGL